MNKTSHRKKSELLIKSKILPNDPGKTQSKPLKKPLIKKQPTKTAIKPEDPKNKTAPSSKSSSRIPLKNKENPKNSLKKWVKLQKKETKEVKNALGVLLNITKNVANKQIDSKKKSLNGSSKKKVSSSEIANYKRFFSEENDEQIEKTRSFFNISYLISIEF